MLVLNINIYVCDNNGRDLYLLGVNDLVWIKTNIVASVECGLSNKLTRDQGHRVKGKGHNCDSKNIIVSYYYNSRPYPFDRNKN